MVVFDKQLRDDGNLSQGIASCQNSFLVEQSLIIKPKSELLNDSANLIQHKESSDSQSANLLDKKSASSPSCTKTKSSRLEAFFALDTSKVSEPCCEELFET